MYIQKINQMPFKGNITLKERNKGSLFVTDCLTDDKEVIKELEGLGKLYTNNGIDKYNNRHFEMITLNTDNIKAMHKFYDGYEYYSIILYFLPKTKTNIDVVMFGDDDLHKRLVNACDKVKGTSLNVEV